MKNRRIDFEINKYTPVPNGGFIFTIIPSISILDDGILIGIFFWEFIIRLIKID